MKQTLEISDELSSIEYLLRLASYYLLFKNDEEHSTNEVIFLSAELQSVAEVIEVSVEKIKLLRAKVNTETK